MQKKYWPYFFSFYKPYMGLFLTDMLFATISAAVVLVIPLIVRYITNVVIYLPAAEARTNIIRLGILCLILIAIELYTDWWTINYGHRMAARIETGMRAELFQHYLKLSVSYYDDHKVGHLLSRITTDIFDITEFYHHGPENLFIPAVKLIGSFIIMLCLNWRLALISFAVVPPITVYAVAMNKKMKEVFLNNRRKLGDINAQIEDSLSGIRVVKSYANEELEQSKFEVGNQAYYQNKCRNYFVMANYQSVVNSSTTFINVICVIGGGLLITRGIVSISDLVTFLLYIGNVTEPIKKLVNFTEEMQNGMAGFERFREIMLIEPDIEDSPNAVDAGRFAGEIDFNDVSFHYNGTHQDVLSHAGLHIGKGEYVALIGPSGAGKTTICSLIPRFYEVDSGVISIDGRDIRDYTQRSLRRNIGIVQQDTYLFGCNVIENIRYGRPDATDDEVIEAAKKANAHDFIMELPNGYQTDIGQNGVKLSGGQKQRISIARAFLMDPPILIFDEATSSLDNHSEKIVQQSLENLAENRTTLVIAHRLSTIRRAERILVLTEDGITEEGTHEDLLAKNGVYASLYRLQFPETVAANE